jgi:hypothetical protein
MTNDQRRVIGVAAYVMGGVLAFIYFVRPLWAWATWDRSKGTLDLGFMQVTSRPAFPSDAQSVIVGLLLPIVLITVGRLIQRRGPKRADE